MTAEREALDAIEQLLNASDRHTPLPMQQPSKMAELLSRIADRVRATGREVWGIAGDGDGRSPHWDDDEHLLFAGGLAALLSMGEARLGMLLTTLVTTSLENVDGVFRPTVLVTTDEQGLRYRLTIEAVR